jgi:hypothetical protein
MYKGPNTIVVDGDTAKILFHTGGYTVIDASDVALVEGVRWAPSGKQSSRYVYDQNGRLLHRVILGVSGSRTPFVDHKDHDTFNNKRDNLRLCTNQQNMFNLKKKKSSRAGFKGVMVRHGKFYAHIMINRKSVSLGIYNSAAEAAAAYNNAATELFGEYACKNEIDASADGTEAP